MIKNNKRSLCILLVVAFIITLLAGCSSELPATKQPEIDKGTGNKIINQQNSLFNNLDSENIDEERIMNIIEELASEKYAGRLTGTEGNRLSAAYITNYFKEIGLESPEGLDDYKQYYTQKVRMINSTPILEIVDKDGNVINSFKYIKQFLPGIGGINEIKGEVTAPVFYLSSPDDYAAGNEKLIGKIIIGPEDIVNEINLAINKQGDLSAFEWIMSKKNGVKGMIAEQKLTNPSRLQKYFPVSVHTYNIDRSDESKGLIQMACDSPAFNEIAREAENGSLVHMKIDYSIEEVEVPNIIGMISGADEKKKNEYIIISAHFDHVGDNKDGTYNAGALDNASGVAAMMEIARVLKDSKIAPAKTILFIAFNGEESGLYGSKYYTENPVFPLDNTVVINMDMVGSAKAMPLYIMDHGMKENKLKTELGNYAKELSVDSEPGTTFRADHMYFNMQGVEAITLISPDEENGYHSPMDTIEDVSKQRIKKVAELVLCYLDKNAY